MGDHKLIFAFFFFLIAFVKTGLLCFSAQAGFKFLDQVILLPPARWVAQTTSVFLHTWSIIFLLLLLYF